MPVIKSSAAAVSLFEAAWIYNTEIACAVCLFEVTLMEDYSF